MNFGFQVRSNLLRFPVYSMIALITLSVLFFSMLVMIYERPYYHYSLEMPYYYFSSISRSTWFVIISMTTVGYGDTITTTPVGRFIDIITILMGAYIMSIVIAVQSSLFQLNQVGKQALIEVTD